MTLKIPRWLSVGLLSAIAVVIAASGWLVRPSAVVSTSSVSRTNEGQDVSRADPALGMQVMRRGSDLQISWDRKAPSIAEARSGVLEIVDGTHATQLALSPADLTSGHILYVPQSRDIELQLTAFTGSGAVNERVRILQAGSARTPEPIVERLAPIARISTAPPSAPPAVSLRVAPDDLRPRATPSPAPAVAEPAKQTEIAAIPAPGIEPPGFAVPGVASPVIPGHTSLQQLTLPQSPEPRASVAGYQPSVQPPVALRQVTPTVSENVRKMITQEVIVRVAMEIDTTGKVISARATDTPGRSGFLAKAAEIAGRSWQFRPALVNGKPVSSTQVVGFRFVPHR